MAAPAQQIEPKAALDQQIAQVVREMLAEQGKAAAASRVNADSSFERDLGLGSLDLVELVVRCEARLEIAVPDEVAEQADTPAGWARAILQGGQEAAKSVYRIVPPPTAPPVAPTEARTLVDALRLHSAAAPDRVVLHVLMQGGGLGRTGAQLLESAELLARGLAAQGIRAQDRVALLVPPGLEYFEAFLAIQLAGATPVPLYAPGPANHLEDHTNEQGAILRETGTSALVTTPALRPLSRILRAVAPDILDAFEPESLRAEGRRTWADLPGPTLAAPAFVQMSSGATGAPKPVAVSHEALLANLRAVGERLELRGGDAVACCLPLAGGWGLLSWSLSLYYGLPFTYVDPRDFAERPDSWLWAIHNSRSTISAAPNAAYDVCARRIPLWTIEGLDLRSWRCAINSGELVRQETVETFTRRLGPFGFRREAMMPTYAIAEAGVMTMPRVESLAAPDSSGYYPLGEALAGLDIRAVEGQVEYRPAGTRAWIATGDLGYFREGNLTITGRGREVLQREGRALSPDPLEAASAQVAGVAPGAAAAFSVRMAGGERLVLVVESAAANTAASSGVVALLRQAVRRVTGEQVDDIVLASPGALPRTGDGRIRRPLAREQYLQGRFNSGGASAGMEQATLWCKHLPSMTRMGARAAHQRADAWLRQWQAASAAGQTALTAARARNVLNQLGHEAVIEGELAAHTLVVVHRCGPLDPVAFATFSRVPLRFAGDSVRAGTPEWLHASLRPLIVSTEEEMRHALDQGVLVQFPDNDLGEPAARSRFRLPPFRVAKAVVPAVVQQARRTTTIRFAKAITPEADAAATRELTRAVLARLRNGHPHA